ncbi:unnamed protein product [Brassica rapa subsp. narinosa]
MSSFFFEKICIQSIVWLLLYHQHSSYGFLIWLLSTSNSFK